MMKIKTYYFRQILIISIILLIALPLLSESPSTYNKRGVQLGKQKQYDTAEREFNKALKIYDQDSAKALHNLAWILELQGKYKEAIEKYEEAGKRNPRQLPSFVRLGYLYYKTGYYIEAVEIGERVLKMDPQNREVIRWLSDAYGKKIILLQQRSRRDRDRRRPIKEDEKDYRKSETPEKQQKKEEEKPETGENFFYNYIAFKTGYIPSYSIQYKEHNDSQVPDQNLKGYSMMLDYNVYIKGFCIGFGVEWQKMKARGMDNNTSPFGHYKFNFLSLYLPIKYQSASGIYFGIAFSGKIMLTADIPEEDSYEPKRQFDFWINTILGYNYHINENAFVCFENRFGWNTTKKQFSEYTAKVGDNLKLKEQNAYDFAFYLGVGTRVKFIPPKEEMGEEKSEE